MRDFFRPRFLTPWGLYFETRRHQKELAALPGYNEIWREQKRLVLPFYFYIALFGFLVLFIRALFFPVFTIVGEVGLIPGMCKVGEILTNRDGEWWCIDSMEKRLQDIELSNCGLSYRLTRKGNEWVCEEYPPRYGEIGNPLLEDPNCRLVRKSSQGDLYTC